MDTFGACDGKGLISSKRMGVSRRHELLEGERVMKSEV